MSRGNITVALFPYCLPEDDKPGFVLMERLVNSTTDCFMLTHTEVPANEESALSSPNRMQTNYRNLAMHIVGKLGSGTTEASPECHKEISDRLVRVFPIQQPYWPWYGGTLRAFQLLCSYDELEEFASGSEYYVMVPIHPDTDLVKAANVSPQAIPPVARFMYLYKAALSTCDNFLTRLRLT